MASSTYSYLGLQKLWIQNGGSPSKAPLAAAVALAESGGNPIASNHNTDGSIDRGLWQINSVHGAQSTFDVNQNVKAAIAISNNGANWNPWTTFTSGAYKKFLDPSNSYTAQAPGLDPLGAASNLAGSLGLPNPLAVPDFLGKLWSALTDPRTWLRIAMGIGALALLIFGLVELSGHRNDVERIATHGIA